MAKRSGWLQYAALPFRFGENGIEVALITSRETKRWIIPKGWPEKKLLAHQVATQEAYEEAGVEGEARIIPLAAFDSIKCFSEGEARLCKVIVFPLEVERELQDWPERGERERAWMSPENASQRVQEPGLQNIFKRVAIDPLWLRQERPLPLGKIPCR